MLSVSTNRFSTDRSPDLWFKTTETISVVSNRFSCHGLPDNSPAENIWQDLFWFVGWNEYVPSPGTGLSSSFYSLSLNSHQILPLFSHLQPWLYLNRGPIAGGSVMSYFSLKMLLRQTWFIYVFVLVSYLVLSWIYFCYIQWPWLI